jgi:hypothetical protein
MARHPSGPHRGPISLAELADLTLGPALASQGFANREIIAQWAMIAGERLAAHSRPHKINWPRRRPGPDEPAEAAALVLKVESAFALEAQQLAPLILQRVNTHLGWPAVDRVILKQGPVDVQAPPEAPAGGEVPVAAPVREAVSSLASPALQDAMARLGMAVLSRKTS